MRQCIDSNIVTSAPSVTQGGKDEADREHSAFKIVIVVLLSAFTQKLW